SWEYTEMALDSFFRYTSMRPQDRFFLIDNDKSLDPQKIGPRFPKIHLLVNEQPLSFAQNGNHVIAMADGYGADAYYINNDVIFTPAWEIPLAQESAGIVGPTGNQDFQYQLASGF